jgi:hypothetical protein
MTILPDGSYHHYRKENSPPRLCQVANGWCFFVDDDEARPIAKMQGKFVRLTEVAEPEREAVER